VSGVFTTARVADGSIVGFDAHRSRLRADAARIGLVGAVDPVLAEAIAIAAQFPEASGMLRVAIGRSGGGTVRRVVAIAPPRRRAWRWEDTPLALTVADDPRPPPDGSGFAKALEHRSALAGLEARAANEGASGVLLRGPEGLREGTFFHLLVAHAGAWVSPPADATCQGTTLARVLAGLGRAGERVERRPLRMEDLADAEVFATSALLEVAPIGRIDTARFEVSRERWDRLRAALE